MSSTLPTGMILHQRYRIDRLLGQGGMGAVYLAEDNRLRGRLCAIKENLPDPTATSQALAEARHQFQEEARILARLDHPNLPKVSDFFRQGRREYLVMDYVEGEDLEKALEEAGRALPERPVLLWMQQILDALQELHNQQPLPIIHRDIKPANIRLTPQGKVKLVDFGLVKLLDARNPRTKAMRGLGTAEYAPLEQYDTNNDHTDARSDIYSLGATMYHLLTNVAPPTANERVLNPKILRAPRRLNPQLSENTERVILRAMGITPAQRYQSAREMKQDLAGTVMVPVPTPTPVSFDVKEVAQWSAGGALVGTVLASLPRLTLSAGTGLAWELPLYFGALLFGAVGAVAGVFIVRQVNIEAPDFLPKLAVTLITTLVLAATCGLVLGTFLFKGGLGLFPLLLAYLGSVGGGVVAIRLTESETFHQAVKQVMP